MQRRGGNTPGSGKLDRWAHEMFKHNYLIQSACGDFRLLLRFSFFAGRCFLLFCCFASMDPPGDRRFFSLCSIRRLWRRVSDTPGMNPLRLGHGIGGGHSVCFTSCNLQQLPFSVSSVFSILPPMSNFLSPLPASLCFYLYTRG